MKIVNLKHLKWLQFSILLMLLDMGSKFWIKSYFYPGEVLFISYCCNFYCVYNAGLAFGLFSNMMVSFRWLFVWIVIAIIIAFIVFLCKSVKLFSKCYYCAYSMIIGGALGNLFDRILYGTVIDFIDIHIGSWHWPTFNLADTEICIGVFILVMRHYYIFLKKNY